MSSRSHIRMCVVQTLLLLFLFFMLIFCTTDLVVSFGSSSLCLCHGCDQMFGSENGKNITSHDGVPSDANEKFTVV